MSAPPQPLKWLCLTAFVAALASAHPQAAGQVGPQLTAPTAPAPAPVGPAPNDSLAAASPPDNVVDVKIAGNKSLPLEKILPSIRTRAGRPFNLELIAGKTSAASTTRISSST